MLQEWHYFFENTRRWRNLRKITIAPGARRRLRRRADADVGVRPHRRPPTTWRFADVVGTRLGMCGVEYFAHPWEFGPRKAKELMLTGDALERRRGAPARHGVSKVFPGDELADRTLEFARRIAQLPTMTALLIKESVNQTVDNMGFYNALERLLHAARAEPLALGRRCTRASTRWRWRRTASRTGRPRRRSSPR